MSAPTSRLDRRTLARTLIDDAVLSFIADTTRTRGYPPTIREIGAHMGWTSSSTTANRLARLQREGRISSVKGCPRTLVVVPTDGNARS